MNRNFPLILYWFNLGFFIFVRVYGNVEGDALNALKTQLHDPQNVLRNWDPTLVNPCTWFGVTCNNQNSVTRLDLGNAGLSGQLVTHLGQLTNLMYLELFSNNLTGGIPKELGNLTELISLDLYLNHLEGDIPDTLAKLQKLRFLRLGNNNLTGTIPLSLTLMMSLVLIDLSNNFLKGYVPTNGSFSLFTPISFAGNPYLSLIQHVPEAPRQYPLQSPPKSQSFSVGSNDIRAILEGFVVGLALVFSGRTITLAWRLCIKTQDHFTDVPAEEDPKVHHGQLRRFSLHELQVATDCFSSKNILGLGAFSKVYKGRLADGSLVAVKRIRDHVQSRELQFQTEVELFSMIVHKNLLWLQGFCMTLTERLLVYPLMVNGSVASCLRDHHLDWPTRKRIALGSARGLAYLHDHCDPKIIHRDVKAANILLDQEFEAVVGDFSIAKLMNSKDADVTTVVHGTIGHIAPEYLSTGKSSEKTDVFGYGVMLLELITGKRAYDLADIANDNGVMLLDWVQGLLRDKKLEVVVDVDLEFNYMRDIVEELIQIALLCTQVEPSQRPKMLEIVKMLEGDGLATESLEEE